MAWAWAQCHGAKWLRLRSRVLTLPPAAMLQGGDSSVVFNNFCVLRGELQGGTAVPTQLFSPSLPFKGRKIDLLTNRCREGKGRPQLPAAPSGLPKASPLPWLGKAEAGGEGVPGEPSRQPACPSDPWSWPLDWGRGRTCGADGGWRSGESWKSPYTHPYVHPCHAAAGGRDLPVPGTHRRSAQ